MKNIYLLPSQNNKSKLATYCYDESKNIKVGELGLQINNTVGWTNCWSEIELYITSDEEIKEGDYVVQINFEKTNTQVIKCETEFQTKIANSKDGGFSKNKIILTTDSDLIKDGVQEINDEFLEWFVKNPSCEVVEVTTYGEYLSLHHSDGFHNLYKIIIPKEESKQETLEDYVLDSDEHNNLKSDDGTYLNFHRQSELLLKGAKLGSEWQQEQNKNLYSEEDLLNFGAFVRIEDKKEKRLFLIQDYFKKWKQI